MTPQDAEKLAEDIRILERLSERPPGLVSGGFAMGVTRQLIDIVRAQHEALKNARPVCHEQAERFMKGEK